MQEKYNKRLFISLIGLIILTVAAWGLTGRENNYEIDKNIFRVSDLKTVDRVLLESPRGKIDLTFNGSRWKVNQYDADRNMINVLFATLQQAEPKRPASASIRDSLITEVERTGTKVSLFTEGKMVKEFYAGGNEAKTQAYFMLPGARDAYSMMIPGYRVYVSGILELDEKDWRDKYVFGFNWRNFQSLTIQFPDKSSENFKVSASKNFFGIEGMEADTAKLNTFLDEISLLTVNRFVGPGNFSDSLVRTKAFMVATVTDIANRSYELKLFKSGGKDVPGLLSGNQAAIFSAQKIQPIIRPKSFFRKP